MSITNLSELRKASIAKLIKKNVERLIDPMVISQGDQIRKLFNIKNYKKKYT